RMGSPFNPDKTEVQFFTRKYKDPWPQISIPLARPPGPYSRYLGVILDQKLNFKEHVGHWNAKARKMTDHLRSLSSFTKGAPPVPIRDATRACALSVAMFGSNVWYQGPTGYDGRPSRHKTQLNVLKRTIAQAAKAVVPSYITTPNNALVREAGFPPAHAAIEEAHRRACHRLQSLDGHHPLRHRFDTRGRLGIASKRMLRRPPFPVAPNQRRKLPSHLSDKKEIKKEREVCPPGNVRVFTDGSKLEDGRTGWGYALYYAGAFQRRGLGSMGTKAEVYDAEIRGTLEGMNEANRFL